MSRTVIFVIKDKVQTRFMQDADVFERFKFIGRLAETTQNESHTHLTAQEILDFYADKDDPAFMIVGVIIPNTDAAFTPDHRVFSTGTSWLTIEDLCHSYDVELPCTLKGETNG